MLQVANYSVRNNAKNRFQCCAPYALRKDIGSLLSMKSAKKNCANIYMEAMLYLHTGES